ncbi:DUF2793 domain-containing protein [Pseudomonas nitroreducens]|uniref:DUF2793 domain-containing protein n=1 Tax=Pseudomonas nitroreducens TaxID=46680 RepID=UPI002448A99E|nr:DUF2793 domain-containing protein [Pseudomonas nitroreducens]MDG9855600.1 DUF2793 domain-containing protein [Pseudomonas nitroreducens]
MTTSAKLGLEYLQNGAANQVLANLTFATLNQVVQLSIVDKDLSAPPGSPADEAAYIVAASPTGAWAGKATQIAWWSAAAGVWNFIVPKAGWMASVLDELDANGIAKRYGFSGSAWALPESSSGGGGSAVVTESTTARTAGLTDNGTYLRFTNASASTFTIPPQSSVAWGATTEIHVRRAAAGNLTLEPGSGVTLNIPSGGTLVMTNNMTVTLKRVASDVWDVIGQTVAT